MVSFATTRPSNSFRLRGADLLEARQDAFDRIATGLLKQGKRSESRGRPCWHNPDTGARCAIGLLMTDEMLRDRHGIQEFMDSMAFTVGIDFVDDAMAIHDRCPPEAWKGALVTFAKKFGLSDACITADDFPPKDWTKWLAKLPPMTAAAFDVSRFMAKPVVKAKVKIRVPKPFSSIFFGDFDDIPTSPYVEYDEIEVDFDDPRVKYLGKAPKPYYASVKVAEDEFVW